LHLGHGLPKPDIGEALMLESALSNMTVADVAQIPIVARHPLSGGNSTQGGIAIAVPHQH
jgi:hypothetical protein